MRGLFGGGFSFFFLFLRASVWHQETLPPFGSLVLSLLRQTEMKRPAPGLSKASVSGLLVISPPATTLTPPVGVTAAAPGAACGQAPPMPRQENCVS